MQKSTTILGVIEYRLKGVSYPNIMTRFNCGSSTAQLIWRKYQELKIPLGDLEAMDSRALEELFYPSKERLTKVNMLPDYEKVYESLNRKGSKANLMLLWEEYRVDNPNGYQYTQFVEHFHRFIDQTHGNRNISMAINRVPGQIVYIDWAGDTLKCILDKNSGELHDAHFFVSTCGLSSYLYVEAFPNEQSKCFLEGNIHALEYYDAIPQILKPDNCKTAVIKNTKDELILNTQYKDLESFYDVIVVPAPALKPKGKATVENHVRWIETWIIEKLHNYYFDSFVELNDRIKTLIEELNNKTFQKMKGTRKQVFELYDKPAMRPLPKDAMVPYEYKVCKVPNNYHVEFDSHYYSLPYSYINQLIVIKASNSHVKLYGEDNHFICEHLRAYKEFPKYITIDDHMPESHQIEKLINDKDGDYYRTVAKNKCVELYTLIDKVLTKYDYEQQAYRSCMGIINKANHCSYEVVKCAAAKCIELNTCTYSSFIKLCDRYTRDGVGVVKASPTTDNVRGKNFYSNKENN